jgi:hypothetical protein
MTKRLYVFALAAGKAGTFRAAGHRIEFVKADAVYAAVERLETGPAVTEAALRAQHDIVAQIAAKVGAILPARFGSLVDTAELERVVALRREAIHDALNLVSGRAQMTVRLFEAEAAVPLAHAATAARSGTEYLQARREAAARRALPLSVAAITAAVKDIVAAERSEAGQGRVAATIYHLVDRAAVDDYKKRLAGIPPGPDSQMMSVSGPWPPFAFVPELWP